MMIAALPSTHLYMPCLVSAGLRLRFSSMTRRAINASTSPLPRRSPAAGRGPGGAVTPWEAPRALSTALRATAIARSSCCFTDSSSASNTCRSSDGMAPMAAVSASYFKTSSIRTARPSSIDLIAASASASARNPSSPEGEGAAPSLTTDTKAAISAA